MAARRGNKQWLRQQLQKALQWDADTTESVVEALAAAAAAGKREEVDDLVEAYTGGERRARQLVAEFCGPAQPAAGPAAPPLPTQPGMAVHQRGAGLRQAESDMGARPSSGRASGAGSSSRAGGSGGGSGGPAVAPEAVEMAPPAGALKPLLDMGRNVPVSVKPSKKKAGGSGGGADAADSAASKRLARPVANCLKCGKIHDCRTLTDEALRFLNSGGICSFCGNRVSLRYADGTTNAPAGSEEAAAAAADAAAAGLPPQPAAGGALADDAELAGFKPESQQGNAADAVAYNDSAAAAVALKDRLVQYDRESAKRTAVLDDQQDWFAIDANAWLTDEERAILKQRERELAEAEEARRRRVVVTVDLLGRKVVVDAAEGGGRGDAAADAAALEAQLDAARAAAEAARAAAAATSAEAAQGGGAAAPTALAAVEEKLKDLRISVNPSMAARHFVFLPPQPQQAQQGQQGRQLAHQQPPAAGRQQPGTEGAPSGSGGRGSGGGAHQRRQRRPPPGGSLSRLQHDDPFELDLMPAPLAADEAGRRALEAAGQQLAAARG